MNELYLFAFANMVVCVIDIFICICRLNAMEGKVLYRVRSEYAIYIGGCFGSGLQPLYGEWPQWGSLGMSTCLMVGLICSGHAWRRDTPPVTATSNVVPLGGPEQ